MRILIKLIILMLLLTGSEVKSQNRWQKVYHDETDALGEYIFESYDHGYLILGWHGANYPKYMWLIKTDLNGEVLWEKTIGDGVNPFALFEMVQNKNGSIYLCGQYNNTDPNGNPIIIKLDTCGEKLWCKEFHTQNNHDFASCITEIPDGGVAMTLNFTGVTSFIDRICLTRLNPDGEILWIKCYNSQDSSLRAEDDFNLIRTPDNGFLITGFCYYEDPTHPNLYWPEPYYIKVDSSGNFQWETVVHKDDPLIGGQAWSTVISSDSLYYYSSISHYYYDNNTSSPALLKMDLQGNVIDIYNVVDGYLNGKLSYATFITDSTLAASAGWGNDDDSLWSNAVIIDTLGNLLNSIVLMQDIYTSILQVTFDRKLVYITNTYQNDQFDVYLQKLNQNLEDDTFYTYPFQYDTLCPHAIASDTITQEGCDIIVGIEEEEMGSKGDGVRVELYPNPASSQINFRLSVVDCRLSIVGCRLSMLIYDLFGREMDEIIIPKGQELTQVDVSDYPAGIYIAILKSEQTILGREKFVVSKQ